MKQKLAILLALKLQAWAAVCQPFTGENPPYDPKLAAQCSKIQIELQDLVYRIDLIQAKEEGDTRVNAVNQPKEN